RLQEDAPRGGARLLSRDQRRARFRPARAGLRAAHRSRRPALDRARDLGRAARGSGARLRVAPVLPLARAVAHGDQPSATQLARQGRKAYDEKDYAGAARLFRQAVEHGAKSSEHAYTGACAAALAGDRTTAFALLEKAVALGLRDVDGMKADPDLVSLHDDPRWGKALAATESNATRYRAIHASPDGARLVTSDVDRFWKVYAKLPGAADPAALLDSEYLDAGTVGLQDFIPDRIGSGNNLYAAIRKHPRYYAAIRDNTLKMAAVEPEVR